MKVVLQGDGMKVVLQGDGMKVVLQGDGLYSFPNFLLMADLLRLLRQRSLTLRNIMPVTYQVFFSFAFISTPDCLNFF
jgi:hypothetical protein